MQCNASHHPCMLCRCIETLRVPCSPLVFAVQLYRGVPPLQSNVTPKQRRRRYVTHSAFTQSKYPFANMSVDSAVNTRLARPTEERVGPSVAVLTSPASNLRLGLGSGESGGVGVPGSHENEICVFSHVSWNKQTSGQNVNKTAERVRWKRRELHSTTLASRSTCERPKLFIAMMACASSLLLTLLTLSSSVWLTFSPSFALGVRRWGAICVKETVQEECG